MATSIRKIGNSAGVILPKPVLETLGAKLGDTVEFVTEGSVVRIEACKRKVREGWEDDFRALAAEGLTEEDREWLEAPLDDAFNSEGFTEDEMRQFEADFAAEAAAKA